jgi:hypothetical protein
MMTNRRLRQTGRSDQQSRHIRLYHYMLKTDAWRDLNCVARSLYVEMAYRYAGVGSNNGKLPYSVREAADTLKVGKSTAQRAFASLEQHGFIVPIKQGAFSLKVRHATEWRLTEFACDVTTALASKEFMKWSSQNQNTVPGVGPKVPEAGPIGPSCGTEQPKIRRYGT